MICKPGMFENRRQFCTALVKAIIALAVLIIFWIFAILIFEPEQITDAPCSIPCCKSPAGLMHLPGNLLTEWKGWME